MERRELEEIARFFAASGHRSPMAYLDLDEKASEEEIEVALKKKRRWAQGQQANPKYRAEALFVIKFNAALRRLLIEERETYEAHFLDGQTQAKLDEIDKFIRGALAVGVLTPQLDAAIRVHGRSLEMADHAVEQRINAIANELGITQSTDDDAGRAASTIDFYALLQVSPFANDNEIAEAYRERYRWARNLRDHDRSGKVLGALDDAWRILRDPERRKRYDQRRDELESVTAGVEKRARALAQLVEGSDGSTPPTADPARTNETALAGIRARTTLPPGPDAPSEPLAVATSLAEGEASPEHSPLRLATTGEVRAPIPNISGRTLGLASGPQQLGERQPRLALPGKTIVRLVVPRSAPVSYPVKVQNAGQGEMPGKLVSDAIWLVVGRAWLDPQARQQDVMVEIRPADMPANRASATLTVVADHGERRVVSFEVSRRSYVLPFIAALTLTAGFASTYFAMQYRSSAVVDSVGPTLRLEIDPPADRVLVDDVLVGAGR
ncbi:MAG: hypothetical protein FJ090_05010, partial [Deltaproteobacteria bacterium]|nr:hypothetical protein [Deltaproteobacteria bacterium]